MWRSRLLRRTLTLRPITIGVSFVIWRSGGRGTAAAVALSVAAGLARRLGALPASAPAAVAIAATERIAINLQIVICVFPRRSRIARGYRRELGRKTSDPQNCCNLFRAEMPQTRTSAVSNLYFPLMKIGLMRCAASHAIAWPAIK
jgi:hypothetical protein